MNDYAAVVLPFDPKDSYVWLRVGKGRLACHGAPGLEGKQKIGVHIRPSDVLLSRNEPIGLSARNILEAKVVGVKPVLEGVYVELDAGFTLSSLITRQAAAELKVRKGQTLFVIIKATSVEIKAAVEAPIRVAIQGINGYIDIKHLDLLRAIDTEGSFTVAAKKLEITYRTAWLWADAMNTVWHTPLLQTAHGGKGGGGAWLTPEGKALLEYATQIEQSAVAGPGRRGHAR